MQFWHDFLKKQGAIFNMGDLLHFGDTIEERKAYGSQNTLTALTTLGTLSFSGPQAKEFLQGQITLNLDDISPTQSGIGAHCNLQGRMQNLFRIFQTQHNDGSIYHLCMPQEMLESALVNFKKYAIFSKVNIQVDQSVVGIGLYGPTADKILCNVFPQVSTLQKPYDSFYQTVGNELTISRLPGHFPRFEIWGNPQVLSAIWLQFVEHCKPVLPQGWELLDIQAGLPAIYLKTVGEVLPHHANLSILNGISYTKGCYLGQEIIARMQYKGKIKKHLYRAYIQDTQIKPEPGTLLYGDASSGEVGIVLRYAENEFGRIEMLVVLDDQFNNFDQVFLNSGDGPKVHRLDLPYHW